MRCVAVVLFCFWYNSAMPRFLLRAHHNNMTNGDFAFFTWFPLQGFNTDRPWRSASRYLDDPNDIPRLRQAYTVVKQVVASLCYMVLSSFAALHAIYLSYTVRSFPQRSLQRLQEQEKMSAPTADMICGRQSSCRASQVLTVN